MTSKILHPHQAKSIPSQRTGQRRHRNREKRRTRSLGDFRLAFGRHLGRALSSIPLDYLLWAVGAEQTPPGDRWAIAEFLKTKEQN